MQKKHRIFIAINLPEDVKKRLAKYQENWPELPCKWTEKDNLHITLEFLGDLTDQELADVCSVCRDTASRTKSFSISLNKIEYGPRLRQGFGGQVPKLIWTESEKSEELSELKKELQEELLERVRFRPDGKGFRPHITLARIREWDFKKIDPEERPEVNEEIDMVFTVESIEVMESELKRGGPVYTVLESCQFKN